MKNATKGILLLLVCGVFGDEVKTVSVMEGDSVTLHTNVTELKGNDKIDWRFKANGSNCLLVEIKPKGFTLRDLCNGLFKDRLQISDLKTGSLTIKNMRIKHSGLYEAEIETDAGTTYKKFTVTVSESRVLDADMFEVKSVSVKEGESVHLHTDIQTQRDDLILWGFGDDIIAKLDKEDNKISLFNDAGGFRDRLKLDDQTGNLIITESKITDSGVYKLKINTNRETKYKTFSVSVETAPMSSGEIAAIVIGVLALCAVIAVIAAVVIYRLIITKQQNQTVKYITVRQGNIHLDPGVKLKSDDVMEWRFGKNKLIATINKKHKQTFTYDGADGRFKDILEVRADTGTLTCKSVEPKHAGLYQMKIISSKGMRRWFSRSLFQFHVTVKGRISQADLGGSVCLENDVKLEKDDMIMWTFGAEDSPIARNINGSNDPPYYDNNNERFKDKLQLDENGSLTVKNITIKHCGFYRSNIISKRRTKFRKFIVCRSVKVNEGETVTLETAGEILNNDHVEWSFRNNQTKSTSENKITLVSGYGSKITYTRDKEFKNRLKMNRVTGDLTIKKIRQTDKGIYTIYSISREDGVILRYYHVFVSGKEEYEAMIKS